MRQTTSTRSLPCKLSDLDLVAIGEKMTHLTLEVQKIEDAKKRIKPMQDEITELAAKWRGGFEDRYVECNILYHTPQTGKKSIVRTDTGEIVEILNMTAEEMQESLDFESEAIVDKARMLAAPRDPNEIDAEYFDIPDNPEDRQRMDDERDGEEDA